MDTCEGEGLVLKNMRQCCEGARPISPAPQGQSSAVISPPSHPTPALHLSHPSTSLHPTHLIHPLQDRGDFGVTRVDQTRASATSHVGLMQKALWRSTERDVKPSTVLARPELAVASIFYACAPAPMAPRSSPSPVLLRPSTLTATLPGQTASQVTRGSASVGPELARHHLISSRLFSSNPVFFRIGELVMDMQLCHGCGPVTLWAGGPCPPRARPREICCGRDLKGMAAALSEALVDISGSHWKPGNDQRDRQARKQLCLYRLHIDRGNAAVIRMAYFRQGVALQYLGRHADALAAFASGLAQDPKSLQLLVGMVEAAMKSPLRESLEPTYQQLQKMKLDKSPFVVVSVIGQELLTAAHHTASVVVLESALKIGTCSLKLRGDQTGECRAHGNLGSAFFSKGNYREALTNHRHQLVLAMKLKDREDTEPQTLFLRYGAP
ncbi:unnamed protein product [Coregonus sp. 'balchen']|nr:unnamed protein product [Coregonus sp. 'balchen']